MMVTLPESEQFGLSSKKVCHRYHNNKQRYCVFVCMRSLQAEYLSDDAKMLWTCLHLQFTNNDKERTHEDLWFPIFNFFSQKIIWTSRILENILKFLRANSVKKLYLYNVIRTKTVTFFQIPYLSNNSLV